MASSENPLDGMPISVISNDSLATISANDYINQINTTDKITMVEKSNYNNDMLKKLKSDFENSKIVIFYGNKEDKDRKSVV